jgi:hypothetical protein
VKTSRKQVSPGLSFVAGTLVGAFAVLVPLTSAGHHLSSAEGPGQRSSGTVSSTAPAAGRNAVDADSASSMKQDASASNAASIETKCDVQLD